MPAILEVEDLRLHYLTRLGKRVQAVDGVSFQLQPGEILGIAGESGCGKTTLVSGLMGLLMPPLHLTSGAVRIAGRDILRLPPATRARTAARSRNVCASASRGSDWRRTRSSTRIRYSCPPG